MAQLIGSIVLAGVAFFATYIFGIFGFCVMGIIVWLSTESFIGAVLFTALAVFAYMNKYVSLSAVPVASAIWTLVWCLKK